MATTGQLWWTTPLQCFAVAASGTMFGGSGLLSPIVSPMLENPEIPAVYQAKQTQQFLHNAERIFPPTNALSSVSNLALVITAYLNRDAIHGQKAVLSARFLPLGFAFGFNAATTAYTLIFMVPKNNMLRSLAEKLVKEPDNAKTLTEFRDVQKLWTAWAWGELIACEKSVSRPNLISIGRAALMLGATITGLYALTVDSKALKI